MADDKPVRPLPERKESFAKKQVERGKGLFSGEPGGSGPPNRHGMPKLPPGQPSTTTLSLEDAMDPDVLLAHTVNDGPLPAEHGGPCRMITPRLYAWKGAKWIRRITLVRENRPGFWERRGYSNTAYPWYEDRYAQR